jgi:hypothetical protein
MAQSQNLSRGTEKSRKTLSEERFEPATSRIKFRGVTAQDNWLSATAGVTYFFTGMSQCQHANMARLSSQNGSHARDHSLAASYLRVL